MSVRTFFTSILPGAHLNKSLRILITVNTILVFTMGLFAPFYAIFVQKVGGTIEFAGLSWAIFSILTGVFIFLFSDWGLHSRKPKFMLALGYRLILFRGFDLKA